MGKIGGKKIPFELRHTSRQNQISIPKAFLTRLGVKEQISSWKVRCNKSRKTITFELL